MEGIQPQAAPKPYPVTETDPTHVVIEIFAGDNNLNNFVHEDMLEIATGMTGRCAVLALADYLDGEGVVVEITTDRGPQVIERVGEIDTGDPYTLSNFLARALATYGTRARKAIGFWDHGSGVFDEYDPNERTSARSLRTVARHRRSRSFPARRLFVPRSLLRSERTRAMLHDDTNGGVLTNREAHKVLEQAFTLSECDPVDLIFSDTCLNGMVEVATQFKEFASVVIGSEDLEPGDGWDYHGWFRRMGEAPPRSSVEWAEQAIDAFDESYRGRSTAHPCTLGAFRTQESISGAFAALVETCRAAGPDAFRWLMDARQQTQSFARRDTFDIRDFGVKLERTASNDAGRERAAALVAAFDAARVKHVSLGADVRDAQGLAFWFPGTRRDFEEVFETYNDLLFAKATHWAEYLQESFLGTDARTRFGVTA